MGWPVLRSGIRSRLDSSAAKAGPTSMTCASSAITYRTPGGTTPPVAAASIPLLTSVRTMIERIAHWIGGALTAGKSGRTGPVYNPATGLPTAEVDLASTAEVATAVASAAKAAREWRHASLSR